MRHYPGSLANRRLLARDCRDHEMPMVLQIGGYPERRRLSDSAISSITLPPGSLTAP
jgi:hypothetical protein